MGDPIEFSLNPVIQSGAGYNFKTGNPAGHWGLGAAAVWNSIDELSGLPVRGVSVYAGPVVSLEDGRKTGNIRVPDVLRLGAAFGSSIWAYVGVPLGLEAGIVPKKNFQDGSSEIGFRTSLNLGAFLNIGPYFEINDMRDLNKKGYLVGGQFYLNFPIIHCHEASVKKCNAPDFIRKFFRKKSPQ